MDHPEITEAPPVHDPGPGGSEREIEGGEVARVGLDSLLREEFERIGTDVAARHTRVAVAVPVPQLVAAVLRIVPDLPRVPDYDDVSARLRRFEEATEYSPVFLPDSDPRSIGVHVDGVSVVLPVDLAGAVGEVALTADYAEEFGLAVVAAARYAKVRKAEAEREREQTRGALILPQGFGR